MLSFVVISAQFVPFFLQFLLFVRLYNQHITRFEIWWTFLYNFVVNFIICSAVEESSKFDRIIFEIHCTSCQSYLLRILETQTGAHIYYWLFQFHLLLVAIICIPIQH